MSRYVAIEGKWAGISKGWPLREGMVVRRLSRLEIDFDLIWSDDLLKPS